MTPVEIMEKVDKLACNIHWKQFHVQDIPVAIYDGASTWLFRHANPGEPFAEVDSHPHVFACKGLHDSVRANSITELFGIVTATVMLEGIGSSDISIIASIVIHEMFHVYQHTRLAERGGNIAHLFSYPADHAEQLHLRRLETAAIRKSLDASTTAESKQWCRKALEVRRRRYLLLPAECVEFECLTERHEGLAHYIELISLCKRTVELPTDDFAPDDIRRRCYPVGCAFAFLLDRYCQGWSQEWIETKSNLDECLAAALDTDTGTAVDFSPEEVTDALRQAEEDIVSMHRRRDEMKRNVYNRAGWQLSLQFTEPMRTWGMDPSNAHRVSETEVLHTRYLRLGNGAGSIEMIGGSALTESAGDHPLMDGIKAVIYFLEREPVLAVKDGFVEAEFSGLKAKLAESSVKEIRIHKIGS